MKLPFSVLQATDPVALVSFKVLALNNGPRPEGYQGHVYPNSELIVSHVGVNISKRICINYKESTLYDAKVKMPPPGRDFVKLVVLSCFYFK